MKLNKTINSGIRLPLSIREGGRLLLFLLILIFASCADRLSDTETAVPDVYVTLSVNVPGSGLPQTRMTDAQQSAINDLRVLVFDEGGQYKYNAPIALLSGSTITVRLLPSPGSEKYQLVLLANAPAPLTNPATGESKETVLKKFVIACTGVWKYDASDATPLPLWGETNAAVVGDNTVFKDKDNSNSSIQMLRALARVDVGVNFTMVNNPTTNTATGLSSFKLKSVRVYNSKNKAYIYTNDPTMPNLPASVPDWGNNPTTPLVYTLTTAETTTHAYCGNIFVPEAAAGALAGDVTATFLVIGGYYGAGNTTTETFYRVDFIDGTGNTPLALLRNHFYRVNIILVGGAGFATADEAKASQPANLTAQVIAWDQTALNKIGWSGNDFFSCSTDTPNLPYTVGAINVPVASNIPASEWVLTNPSSKLTVTKPATATPQGGNLTFTAKGTGGTADGLAAGETVSVTLKARNMTMTFTVSQLQEENLMSGTPGINESGNSGEWTANVPTRNLYSGANCFIVSTAGNWRLDASIKGNGKRVYLPADLNPLSIAAVVPTTMELMNITGGASAEVLWETTNRTTAPTVGSVVKDVSYDAATKQIRFTTTANKGNALIALKDASGTILWSWHIWRTNEQPVAIPLTAITATNGKVLAAEGELKVMDRNLGALSTADDLSAGLLYQWGRKDPFAGAATLSTTITSMAFNRVNNGSDVAWPAVLTIPGSDAIILANAVKNPTIFFSGIVNNDAYIWCSRNDNLWGTPLTTVATVNTHFTSYTYNANKGNKTIYDPCPAGWRVGPEYTFAYVYQGSQLTTGVFSFPIGKENVGVVCSAAGYRNSNGDLIQVGGVTHIWSASLCSGKVTDAGTMGFNSSGGAAASFASRSYASTVRCVAE